jgi:hypothetical protein
MGKSSAARTLFHIGNPRLGRRFPQHMHRGFSLAIDKGKTRKPSPSAPKRVRKVLFRASRDGALQLAMGAVAKRLILGVLAAAEPDLFLLGQFDGHRRERGGFMGSVAEGLIRRTATGTPPVFAGFKLQTIRGFLWADGFRHGGILACSQELGRAVRVRDTHRVPWAERTRSPDCGSGRRRDRRR